MRYTALHQEHVDRGARMIEFAGWEMPVFYSGITEEHLTVRSSVGLFDISHMGDVLVRGDGAEDFLSQLVTNDVCHLPVGKAVYAHILNPEGKILDDTIVYRLAEMEYLLVPNAATTPKIVEWMHAQGPSQEMEDVSSLLSCIAIQGPRSVEVLGKVLGEEATQVKRFHCRSLPYPSSSVRDGVWPGQVLVSRTGYTGEDGFELLLDNGDAVALWRELLHAGAPYSIRPIGLGARDTLRLEMGYLLSGTDFDGSQSSLQTGPDWVVKWDHEFIGREALLQERELELPRLVGVELLGKGIPRYGYELHMEGELVGRVTSGTLSPSLKKGIALAYLLPRLTAPGTKVEMVIRDAMVPAEVVRTPFYHR